MYIFGYGSLMWNPDFSYLKKEYANLIGYQRNFCIKTHTHRGNINNYGLVLGLDPKKNNLCRGVLFKVDKNEYIQIKKKLDIRELNENSYIDKIVKVNINNKKVKALTYISNNKSELYTNINCKDKAEIIKNAEGFSGKNIDYYINTLKKLEDMGVTNEYIFNIKKYL